VWCRPRAAQIAPSTPPPSSSITSNPFSNHKMPGNSISPVNQGNPFAANKPFFSQPFSNQRRPSPALYPMSDDESPQGGTQLDDLGAGRVPVRRGSGNRYDASLAGSTSASAANPFSKKPSPALAALSEVEDDRSTRSANSSSRSSPRPSRLPPSNSSIARQSPNSSASLIHNTSNYNGNVSNPGSRNNSDSDTESPLPRELGGARLGSMKNVMDDYYDFERNRERDMEKEKDTRAIERQKSAPVAPSALLQPALSRSNSDTFDNYRPTNGKPPSSSSARTPTAHTSANRFSPRAQGSGPSVVISPPNKKGGDGTWQCLNCQNIEPLTETFCNACAVRRGATGQKGNTAKIYYSPTY
jgi:hypothetical protein